jgi:hypothetical protein
LIAQTLSPKTHDDSRGGNSAWNFALDDIGLGIQIKEMMTSKIFGCITSVIRLIAQVH